MRLRDPGAVPERTALAWSRTTMALIGAGLLCVRLAPSAPGTVLAAAVVSGGAALMLRRTHRSFHARRALPSGAGAADPVSILITTGLAMLLAGVVAAFAF